MTVSLNGGSPSPILIECFRAEFEMGVQWRAHTSPSIWYSPGPAMQIPFVSRQTGQGCPGQAEGHVCSLVVGCMAVFSPECSAPWVVLDKLGASPGVLLWVPEDPQGGLGSWEFLLSELEAHWPWELWIPKPEFLLVAAHSH